LGWKGITLGFFLDRSGISEADDSEGVSDEKTIAMNLAISNRLIRAVPLRRIIAS
jgi:hypothetical protein